MTAARPLDPTWFARAAARQARLTMPTGALGRLLDLGQRLCAIQETLAPAADPAAILLMAADHGVAAEGVSAYPPAVTGQMVANFLRGGAAINVLARRVSACVLVADVGVTDPTRLDDFAGHPDFVRLEGARPGSRNFTRAPALAPAEVDRAVSFGRQLVRERLPEVRVLALGEMGIGNTTSASALTAALTGLPARAVTGRGTGLDDTGWLRKVDTVGRALERHFGSNPGPVPPLPALAAVGGFEIAGLVGAVLEAAARRKVVVLDGFISSVAGLLAVRLDPPVRDYLVAGHRSPEPGHAVVLQALGLVPLLDLGLRLGEGSGAALALHLIHSAADILNEMATFETAGVSDRPAPLEEGATDETRMKHG
jgi:nicotinate-nucleotide--dimethylbenzimidazole phosphoribosyltransferase